MIFCKKLTAFSKAECDDETSEVHKHCPKTCKKCTCRRSVKEVHDNWDCQQHFKRVAKKSRQVIWKGGFRHKAHYYNERVILVIRHFSNCSTLHRNALAAWGACLDPRLPHLSSWRTQATTFVFTSSWTKMSLVTIFFKSSLSFQSQYIRVKIDMQNRGYERKGIILTIPVAKKFPWFPVSDFPRFYD